MTSEARRRRRARDGGRHGDLAAGVQLGGRLGECSRFAVALTTVLFVGAGLRLYRLGAHSLWFDEALEYQRAAGSWRLALLGRSIDQDPPLFALWNHAWASFGQSEAWLRLPSAVLGVATIALIALWARRSLGPRIGLIAAALAACAPVLVHYSQELNQYAALVFLSVATIIAFEVLIERGDKASWIAFTVLSVVGLATHFGLAFLLAALGLYLAHWARGPQAGHRARRRRLAVYTAVVGAAVVGLWWLGLGDGLAVPHLDRRLGGTHLEKELAYITDVGWREVLVFYLLPFSGGPSLVAVRLMAVVAAVGAVAAWRRGRSGRRLVGLYFFGALALTYLASLMGWYPLGFRYGLFAAPALLVALAAGLDWLWRRSAPAGLLATASTIGAFLLFSPHVDSANAFLTVPREGLRPVWSYVEARAGPEDMTYIYFGAAPAFSYYGREWGGPTVVGEQFDDRTVDEEAVRLASAVAIDGGVWLIMSHVRPGDEEALLAALARQRRGGRGLTEVERFTRENALAFRLAWRPIDQTPPTRAPRSWGRTE